MKAAWSDVPGVRFDGRFWQLDDLPILPKPVQRPRPPLWSEQRAPGPCLAARHGDALLGGIVKLV